jgi:excisionase family DNA binding protein
MAKMFYTTDEAAQKLGVSNDQLKGLVGENKLREFRDGARVMFKVDQVDKLAADRKGGTAGGAKAGTGGPIGLADSGVGLAPGDSHASDVISLADTGTASLSKDDTVVTGEGKKVFKPGEVKSPADTGAQTQIQSAIDDQLSLEGVGSGSGLLDLTRESDDTSLGAELLDEIYPGGGDAKSESGIGSASGIFSDTTAGGSAAGGSAAGESSGPSGLENITTSTPTAPVLVGDYAEPNDPTSGAFGGLAFASVLIAVVTGLVALAFFQGFTPAWVTALTVSTTNVLIFGVVLLVVSALFAGFGFFMGRGTR